MDVYHCTPDVCLPPYLKNLEVLHVLYLTLWLTLYKGLALFPGLKMRRPGIEANKGPTTNTAAAY